MQYVALQNCCPGFNAVKYSIITPNTEARIAAMETTATSLPNVSQIRQLLFSPCHRNLEMSGFVQFRNVRFGVLMGTEFGGGCRSEA